MQPKLSILKSHSKTAVHKENIKQRHDPSLRTLHQCTPAAIDKVKLIKESEIKLVAFIAEHNLPFRVMDHLSDLISSVCPDSEIASSIKCKRSKTTAIVKNVTGTHFQQSLAATLRTSKFSVIVDETTDVASVKEMCIITRYFDENNKKILSSFFGLIEVPRADAETLFQDLKRHFESNEIPLGNIIGYASDGANVMMGCNNSVRTRMEATIPSIFIMRCICHSAHLAASNACTALPKETEDFVRDVSSYFSHSAKRLATLKQFQYFTETEPHKILRPAQTRWLSLKQCVNRLVEQWEALTQFFQHESNQQGIAGTSQAAKLHGYLINPHFKLYFLFLDYILPKFTKFNLLFQSQTPNIHVLHNEIQLLYKDFLSCYMKPTYLKTIDLQDLDPESTAFMLPLSSLYLGVAVTTELIKPEILANKELVQHFLRKCLAFLVTGAKEIRKRFPVNDPIFQSLQVLNPKKSDQYSTLLPLASRFPNIIPTESLQTLDNEWRQLKFATIPLDKDLPVDQYWGQLSLITNAFPTVCNFMKSLLSLPHSSADAERLFSAVNLIKTDTRNRLNTSTMSAILFTKEGVKKTSGDCTKFAPPSKMIELMTSENLYSTQETED